MHTIPHLNKFIGNNKRDSTRDPRPRCQVFVSKAPYHLLITYLHVLKFSLIFVMIIKEF